MTDVAEPFVLLKTFHNLFLCSYVFVSKEKRKGKLNDKINSDQTKVGKPSIINSGSPSLVFM